MPRSVEFVIIDRELPYQAVDRPVFEMVRYGGGQHFDDYSLSYAEPGNGRRIELGLVRVLQIRGEVGTALAGRFVRLAARFVSLGQSFSYYERLADLPGDLGQRALGALRDIVLSRAALRNAENSPHFDLVAKDSRALRALEDAPRLFQGGDGDFVSTLPLLWRASLSIDGQRTQFGMNFEPVFEGVPSNVIALVGDNGAGKSRLLQAIADAAIMDQARRARPDLLTPDGEAVHVSRVVTISYGAFDQSTIVDSDDGLVARSVSTTHIYQGLRALNVRTGKLTNRLKSRRVLEAEVRFDIRELSDVRIGIFEELLDLIRQVTAVPIQLRRDQSGLDVVGLPRLSSGQLMVVSVLVSLSAHLEPGSLVLVDEPEIHLHPPLISAVIRAIAVATERFGSVAILATHSSVVVQQLQTRNVLVVWRDDRGPISIGSPDIETYGESLGIIDRAVFGMAGIPTGSQVVLQRLAETPTDPVEVLGRVSDQASAVIEALRRT